MLSTETLISAGLGAGGAITGAWAVATQWRDRYRRQAKQEGEIRLDDTTRIRIAAEAAQINSDERIATEKWWKEQFDAVKAELVEEQQWRRSMARQLKPHRAWDQHIRCDFEIESVKLACPDQLRDRLAVDAARFERMPRGD